MKRINLFIVTSLLISVFGFGQNTFEGKVFNKNTKQPIENATIFFQT